MLIYVCVLNQVVNTCIIGHMYLLQLVPYAKVIVDGKDLGMALVVVVVLLVEVVLVVVVEVEVVIVAVVMVALMLEMCWQ